MIGILCLFLQNKNRRHVIIMKVIRMFLLCSLMVVAAGCSNQKRNMEKETIVCFETSLGAIRVKLYQDTPKHRDNFVKLVKEGVYDNVLFHRVIRNFMIQTGDPGLKPAGMKPAVDTTQYQYTIPAEIVYPKHFHKKGALAAARMGDDVNPERASSGTQFYIVTGHTYDGAQLMQLHQAIYQSKVDECYDTLSRSRMKELFLLRRSGDREKYMGLKEELMRQAEKMVAENPPAYFNEQQKAVYSKEGGAPHLDGEYTVFGEVIEGIQVAEAIEKVKTRKDRPVEEIVLKKAYVEE